MLLLCLFCSAYQISLADYSAYLHELRVSCTLWSILRSISGWFLNFKSLPCAMAQKLISKGLETFSSCLLYTCETVYYNMVAAVKREHHLPGQCSLSAHWTAQNRRPFLSTRGWAGESSRQWISSKAATFDCSSSSQVWVCKRLTLANVVQYLRLSRRNRPAQFFCSNRAELFVQSGV